MLISLGKKAENDGTVKSRLLDCHERIRRFCALAVRLAAGGSPDDTRQAATELRRYFGIALPLHVADEEESLRPRLERADGDKMNDALDTMAREHVEVEEALIELMPRWQEILDVATPEACALTKDAAAWLSEHMRGHLEREETLIFPALDRLPVAQQAAIVAEMKARRQK